MKTQKEGAAHQAQQNQIYNRVIKSDLILENGSKVQLITLLPIGFVGTVDLVGGLNVGLQNTYRVVMAQHTISRINEDKTLKPAIEFEPIIFKIV